MPKISGFVPTRETPGGTGDTAAALADIVRRLDALEARLGA